MSPRKHYFAEPAVRIEVVRGKFPKMCPICGQPGTRLARITIVSGRKQYLRRSWDPYYDRIRTKTISSTILGSLL